MQMEAIIMWLAGYAIHLGFLFYIVRDASKSKQAIAELQMINKNLTLMMEGKKS